MSNDLLLNRHATKNSEGHKEIEVVNKEEKDKLAASFPEWTLTPPTVLVRRVRRK